MTNRIKIHVNQMAGPYQAGDEVQVEVDEEGTPLEKFWRDRLRDSAYDNCVSIVEEKAEPKRSKRAPTEDEDK